MNDNFSAIIEENIFMDDAVVFDCQVVAERDFHAVEYLYVLAAMFEDVTGEHGAHPKAQPVIQSHGRAVVHHPKPDERLALGVFHCIDVPVVFGLECRVARIEGMKYAERKPLIWFWMMYDRSPVGLNHWLGFRMRAMLARHVFKHCGKNVKIFHGVEVSFGYNLTVEDNCVIHKYVFLDDRGEIIIHEGSSISDYANVYSHAHDLNDGMIVSNHKTEIGPKARVTYHATVLSGVRVAEHGMVGSLGVAAKDVPSFNVVAGIPAKTIKVKSIAPEEIPKNTPK